METPAGAVSASRFRMSGRGGLCCNGVGVQWRLFFRRLERGSGRAASGSSRGVEHWGLQRRFVGNSDLAGDLPLNAFALPSAGAAVFCRPHTHTRGIPADREMTPDEEQANRKQCCL